MRARRSYNSPMLRPRPEQPLQDSADESPEAPAAEGPVRKPWRTPRLRRLGTLEDLVLGGGKAGTLVDGDPRATRKRGTG